MSIDQQPAESAVGAVRRWEELAADRTAAADRVAELRADAQARAAALLADARVRSERRAAQRRQEILDDAISDAELTRARAAAAVAELHAAADARRAESLSAALGAILPPVATAAPRPAEAIERDAACSSA